MMGVVGSLVLDRGGGMIVDVFGGWLVGALAPQMVRLATSYLWLAAGFLAAIFLIVAGILFVSRARFGVAAVVSGVSWIVLGVLGAWIAERPLPSTHAISLIENGPLDLRTPLR